MLCKYFLEDSEFVGPESVYRPVDGVSMVELLSHRDRVWLPLFAWQSDVVNISIVDLAVAAVGDFALAERGPSYAGDIL